MATSDNYSFKGAIIDMDGVITQTARLHAKAWKEMFDAFLKKRNGDRFQPLELDADYDKYMDGMPRFEGVRNFLRSRNITLPEGGPDDGPDSETVHGLGMRKNALFLKLLDKEGVTVYPDTAEMVRKWKQRGVRLAVISSSRNCKRIMASTGLADLFDARVDGETAKDANIKGKPEPDIFFKACERLGTGVNDTIVLEDSIAGVQAGKKGKFAAVIGVARQGEGEALKQSGADIVVRGLTELDRRIAQWQAGKPAEDLPDAIAEIEKIFGIFRNRRPFLFLDYDGTLTPIVPDPDDAILSGDMKEILEELSEIIHVGVISGRDRKDLVGKVQVDTLIYAGSHGFDITGPGGLQLQYEAGKKTLPALDEAEENLAGKLADVDGVKIERKKYAIAVHFRNASRDRIGEIDQVVHAEIDRQAALKIGTGKEILELKPDLDWNKGKAINWIMETLQINPQKSIPVFIGDDITDEDAFKAVSPDGVGIIVGSHGDRTAASFRLKDPGEVFVFLQRLKDRFQE